MTTYTSNFSIDSEQAQTNGANGFAHADRANGFARDNADREGSHGKATNGARQLLSEQDLAYLVARAQSPELIKAAGHYTEPEASEVQKLGFSKQQSLTVPVMVTPILTIHGTVNGYEITPRNPRYDKKTKKLRKRELPRNWRSSLYASPATLQHRDNPLIDMLLTESTHKANAGAVWPDATVFAVGSLGVTGTRGRNEHGGIAPLQDFDAIPFKGKDKHGVEIVRTVWLVPDSNFATNPDVRAATIRTRDDLVRRGARVRIIVLPNGPGGKSQGLDDHRAQHPNATFADLCALELKDDDPAASPVPSYERRPEGMFHNTVRRDGSPTSIQLTNFSASIVEDIEKNDGVETVREYRVELACRGRTYDVTVPSAGFANLGWVGEKVGPVPIWYAGNGIKDHARVAIQTGPEPRRRSVRTHTGWIEVQGAPQFLHIGGAIGGSPEIEVALPPQLAALNIPAASPDEIVAGMRSSLGLLDLAADDIMAPLVSCVYRAPLGSCDHGVYIHGHTGLFKTELATLAQQHYGADFSSRGLASWSSTANALEMLAFSAKDVVLVVDDLFGADVGFAEKQRQQAAAERIFRGSANGASRDRLTQRLELRPSKPSRCLIIGTGEEAPRGESLNARMWVIPVTEDDTGRGRMDLARLTAAQKAAREGKLAHAMRAYIEYLTPKYERIRDGLRDRVSKYRDKAAGAIGKCHARTPAIIGSLYVGFDTFIDAALEHKAISLAEADAYRERAWLALVSAGAAQAQSQASQEPAHRFIELVMAAVSAGKAWVAARKAPQISEGECSHRYAWFHGTSDKGLRVGWFDGDDAYLDPDASYKAACEMSVDGSGISISLETLKRRLKDQGLLASTDTNHRKICIRRTIEGQEHAVLHFTAATLGMTDPTLQKTEAPTAITKY